MLKLYHAPMSRSIRILWLLEELGVPYELVRMPPISSHTPFSQETPHGKVPAIEDGGITMFESGAILEYVLERYGEGRLAPPPGDPLRAPFLQWVHFAEATAFPPLGYIARHTFALPEDQRVSECVGDNREIVQPILDVVEQELDGNSYLLGEAFSAADIMLGYTLLIARWLKLIGERPNIRAYLERIEARPAFQKALA